jgi:lipopolysaccharide/colanic/teichoic acid biosynthesis glycosyltransferase
MRILLLTQWFDPEPTFKGLSFAQELIRLGHEVEVLTGFPNYPGGKIYAGYKIQLFKKETLGGVWVNRVALYPSHDTSALGRILNYVSFAFSCAILGPCLIKRPDVVYCYQPPATVALAALAFRFLRGVPFVLDIQDLWPDTLQATGMVNSPFLLRATGLWCRWINALADRVVVLSPGFKKRLEERGVPSHKIRVIYNWADDNHFAPNQAPPLVTDKFSVVFAGTMGKAQALDSVLDSALLLKDKAPEIQIIFIGGGIEREALVRRANEMALTNVVFLERRPISAMSEILNAADVLLVHLKSDPLFEITIPSKIQAYLATGKPILVAVPGDASQLVERAGAGISCRPEDPAALAEAILSLSKTPKAKLIEMGNNGREFYKQNLSRSVGAEKFTEIFAATTKRPLFQSACQRLLDIIFASLLLILTSPFLLSAALLIRVKMGRPIFFRQSRAGKFGKPFHIFKLRSMSNDLGPDGSLLSDEERLLPLGKFIRRYSLDELPQLWNVIRGELSLVGPRPLLLQYSSRYTPFQARRLDVKPGITGWAQVNGRNAISWEERFKLDVWYVENRTLWLYFKILGLTLVKTLNREGISQQNHATMPEFMGIKSEA